MRRGLAYLLLLLLGTYAMQKWAIGKLPEMLWGCHLASLLIATSVLFERPRGSAVGFLFYVAVGFPAWLLELAANWATLPHSEFFRQLPVANVALHLLTPIAGALEVRDHGLPRLAFLQAWIFFLGVILLGRLAGPDLNVNLAFRPWSPMPLHEAWISHALNLAGSLFCLFLAQSLFQRPGVADASVTDV